MKVIRIIRERGQLTIPESIRKVVRWMQPLSAITIAVTSDQEIIIRPLHPQVDWHDIWKKIKKARKITGKNSLSAADFLEKDRQSH